MNFEQMMAAAQAEVLKILGSSGVGTAPDDVRKQTFAIAGAQFGVSLEAPAKQIIPYVASPWVRDMPRAAVATGNTHQYRRITNLATTGKSTAAEGVRGGAVALTQDAPVVNFGIISSGVFDVTYEAERAAGTYDDLLARATTNALLKGMQYEGAHIFGGQTAALAAPGNIAAADEGAAPVSTLANVNYFVNVKALNGPALQKAILAGACTLPRANQTFTPHLCVVDQTDGWGPEGVEANVSPIPAAHCMHVTWDPVPGAAAYGVFFSTVTGIANLHCIGVTGQCSILIDAPDVAGSSHGIAGDNSVDANDFNGFLALCNVGGSNAYIRNLGATLAVAAGNGIPEIDEALAVIYSRTVGIDDIDIVCSPNVRSLITRRLGTGAANTLIRLGLPTGPENTFAGGAFANKYIHPLTGRLLNIVTDPYQWDGMLEFRPKSIPYPMAEIDGPLKMWLSYDWANFAYAVVLPRRDYENRMRGGLAMYVPPACGYIHNIWNA